MKHLFGLEGRAALEALMRARPLLAFDFDGTLAPIVARPSAARVPTAVAQRLRRLAKRLPVAVVSGRAIADLRHRLGFEPSFVVGSHGAEDGLDPGLARLRASKLDALRARIGARHAELSTAGILVEDKSQSLALHYRLAPDRERAQALIDDLLGGAGPEVEIFGGKMVANVVAAGSPDKAHAVRQLAARSRTTHVFFAGDDVNDEPVFAAAGPHWLTVRIGRACRDSKARYFLDGPAEMAIALQAMLDALDRQRSDAP